MKIYKIPVFWEVWGKMEVCADSIGDAISQINGPELGLPTPHVYIEDSIHMDWDGMAIYNDLNEEDKESVEILKEDEERSKT